MLWRPAAATLVMAIAMAPLIAWPDQAAWGHWTRITVSVAVGTLTYLLVTWAVNRPTLLNAWSLVRGALFERKAQ
jgi:hypothetical protein